MPNVTTTPMQHKTRHQRPHKLMIGAALIATVGLTAQQANAEVQAEMAGVSAAVVGEITLAKAGDGIGVLVESGMPVYLGDRITTSPSSGMQILLLDETVFTIGPDSDVAIDEFVYDPVTGDGRIVADMARGVMRFVTGKIPLNNPSSMDVNLPVGSIGIRGTIGLIRSMTANQANQIIPGSFDTSGPQSGNQPVFMAVNQGPGLSRNDTTSRPGAFAAFNQNGNSQSVTGENFGVFVSGNAVTPPVRFPPSAATFDFSTNVTRTTSNSGRNSNSGNNSGSGSSGSSSSGGSGSQQVALNSQQTGQASNQTGATGAQSFGLAIAQLNNTNGGSNSTETTSILNNNTENTPNTASGFTYDALRTITSGSATTGSIPVWGSQLSYNFSTTVDYANRRIDIDFTGVSEGMITDGSASISQFDYSSINGSVAFKGNDFTYNEDCGTLGCSGSVTFKDATHVDFSLKTDVVPEGEGSSGTLTEQ